jgi:endonuclease G, mitochondrial
MSTSASNDQLTALAQDAELRDSLIEAATRRLQQDKMRNAGGLENAGGPESAGPESSAFGSGFEGGSGNLDFAAPARRGDSRAASGGLDVALSEPSASARHALDRGDFSKMRGTGLEAIVQLIGRPVFFVQNGKIVVPANADIAQVMLDRVNQSKARVEVQMPAIGRLDVLNSRRFSQVGTAWLVRGNIAVTNRHVAEVFASQGGAAVTLLRNEDSQEFRSGVDFRREHGDTRPAAPLRIEKVLHVAARNAPDLAFVRLAGDALPPAVPLDPDPVKPGADVMIVGYPARDRNQDEAEMDRIFAHTYGVKRAAPGRCLPSQREASVFEHDCTSLNGNSGSVILSMASGRAVGLHFAGAYLATNAAVRAQTVLEALDKLR